MREEQIARKEKPRYTGLCRDRKRAASGSGAGGALPQPARRRRGGRGPGPRAGHIPETRSSMTSSLRAPTARRLTTSAWWWTIMDMGITHVIRGDDHLNNTPRQMNMLRALGATPPVYAHVPMILGPDGAKLSKRHGAVSVLQYEEEGYLPDALLNYLVRLGWSHGDQEVFTREEMIAAFDIHDVNKAASAFNREKLLWLNQQHMMRAQPAAHRAAPARAAAPARPGQRRSAPARGSDPRPARAGEDPEGDGAEQPLLLHRCRGDRPQGGAPSTSREEGSRCWPRCASGSARCREWSTAAIHACAERAGDGPRGRAGQDRPAGARGRDRYGGIAPDRCDAGAAGPRACAGAHRCGAETRFFLTVRRGLRTFAGLRPAALRGGSGSNVGP